MLETKCESQYERCMGDAHWPLSYRKTEEFLVLTSVQKHDHVKPILFLAKNTVPDTWLQQNDKFHGILEKCQIPQSELWRPQGTNWDE